MKLALAALVREGSTEIDMVHWMSRAALELIGRAGLGHSFDSLVENVPNDFAVAIKAVP